MLNLLPEIWPEKNFVGKYAAGVNWIAENNKNNYPYHSALHLVGASRVVENNDQNAGNTCGHPINLFYDAG